MKQFSAKRSIQLLAHILKNYGITQLVISPGSRNAPLAIHFSEDDAFHCYSIVDERSAGFTALGQLLIIEVDANRSALRGDFADQFVRQRTRVVMDCPRIGMRTPWRRRL